MWISVDLYWKQFFMIFFTIIITLVTLGIRRAGVDLAAGGGGRPLPSGIRTPADPKGPPFDTFSEIHFSPTDPKIFLKAPLAPIYTNFEGER